MRKKDLGNRMFVVLELEKVASPTAVHTSWPVLKPCSYKRR